ncbi:MULTISPECIES: hypothetical protein [unclassified Pseudoalteromonas]|uniref:hypothetical protein n=1 Tax=unclassified Pseudoalteromonas TaxID=194690 RepID=UPI0016031ACB|nr:MULTISPECIES: hypothetical protein [unclassified Pseudoalteromonas]MBB1333242.1 hypothetical protein [Pseudoalteromonas sp. SR41-6]MBB1458942.1 hypothetical protein [Pseudoalteromonas sp. SG41-8]MBB1477916.1 hypothetical protein [Pseudoalteromonas sp. SG41-2]
MPIKLLVVFLSALHMLMACGPQPLSIEAQTQDASCRPNQLCEYDNQVKIWLSEQQITPETPFEIHLSLPSTLLVHSAKLEGITMYMGYIPVLFEPRNDILVAQGMVGICSERNMTWKLTLEVKNPQGQLKQIFYYFDATY